MVFLSDEIPCSLSLEMEETATSGRHGQLVLSSLRKFWTVKRKGKNELALSLQCQQVLMANTKGRHKLVCGLTCAPTVRQNRPPMAVLRSTGAVLQQGGGRGGVCGTTVQVHEKKGRSVDAACEPDVEVVWRWSQAQ